VQYNEILCHGEPPSAPRDRGDHIVADFVKDNKKRRKEVKNFLTNCTAPICTDSTKNPMVVGIFLKLSSFERYFLNVGGVLFFKK
jgi:hypothetical protein